MIRIYLFSFSFFLSIIQFVNAQAPLSDDDPYFNNSTTFSKAEFPIAGGFMASLNKSLYGLEAKKESIPVYFEIAAFLDAWQLNLKRDFQGISARLTNRNLGRDITSGTYFQYLKPDPFYLLVDDEETYKYDKIGAKITGGASIVSIGFILEPNFYNRFDHGFAADFNFGYLFSMQDFFTLTGELSYKFRIPFSTFAFIPEAGINYGIYPKMDVFYDFPFYDTKVEGYFDDLRDNYHFAFIPYLTLTFAYNFNY